MSSERIAHGMDGNLVKPDWPPLALEEVRSLLALYPEAGEVRRILTTSPRPFSAASVVATSRGPVFVKRHHRSLRDAEGLREEHHFMRHLRAHGAAVPRVLAAHDGRTAIEMDSWTYETHETPAGVDLYEDALSWTPFRSVAHARSAGEALAGMHKAAAGYAAPPRKIQPLVAGFSIFASLAPANAMHTYCAARPALAADRLTRQCCDDALELLSPFHAELLPLLPSLAPLWTHNDLHASNLFWSDASDRAQATAMIDFGLADRTLAVHDIAQAIERNIVEWLALMQNPARPDAAVVHVDHLEALLAGYDTVRPLSAEEAEALAPMTALCHAEFALAEADYFLGVLHKPEKAKLASDDYLVGHARWFRSTCGHKLLDGLRRWADARTLRTPEVAHG